jgi:hypothetical protein
LSGQLTDIDEAEAINYAYQQNHIYSCSWGPTDDGRSLEAPQGVVLKAFLTGIEKGRDKKGSIFVFASGNGAASGDNCNFDGYTNSIYTITVGSIDRHNRHPFYSEQCSALLVTTYSSSGSADYIVSYQNICFCFLGRYIFSHFTSTVYNRCWYTYLLQYAWWYLSCSSNCCWYFGPCFRA